VRLALVLGLRDDDIDGPRFLAIPCGKAATTTLTLVLPRRSAAGYLSLVAQVGESLDRPAIRVTDQPDH
jgi:hypothetical protein